MALTSETRARIESLIASKPVVLFMKGTRDVPQCGFSATVCGILDGLLEEYATVDVLADSAIREGIKELSSWPTIPQLYVRGEFVGGCDVVKEMAASGELHAALGVEHPEVKEIHFTISVTAAEEIRKAAERMDVAPGYALRIRVDARGRHQLGFDREGPGDQGIESNGIRAIVDLGTAARIHGLSLDARTGPNGPEFRIVAPGVAYAEPAGQGGVRQATPREAKQLRDAGVCLVDVRTPEEWEMARITGARLLDDRLFNELLALDRGTPIVFHCHHGTRSQAAAEHFASLGFREVYNLAGGIDAWSQEVDATVPRY
jgi:monothiol glutaredoxin